MKLSWLVLLLASGTILTACGDEQTTKESESSTSHHSMANTEQNGPMNHEQLQLKNNEGKERLTFPEILKPDAQHGNKVEYTLVAQKGTTELFKGYETETFGYNGNLLGPTIRLEKGQQVTMHLKNELSEGTTFHWHGLEVAGDADGGPHKILEPGEEKTITFNVKQPAATLWYHPHPMGNTAQQVYKGLAGFMYIDDAPSKQLHIPNEYGKNDFPIVLQDRTFTSGKQLNYAEVANIDGTYGDTMLINGKVNPYLQTDQQKIRLRILNGSNARNYLLHFEGDLPFTQIASDGGFLEKAVPMKELLLGAGERAEIIVDLSKVKGKSTINLLDSNDTVIMPIHVTNKTIQNEVDKTYTKIAHDAKLDSQEVSKVIKMEGMKENVTLNGKTFDEKRIDFTQKQGVTEIWEVENAITDEGGMIHPFHIHGTQFKVLSINGEKPEENLRGYKDTITLQPGQKAKLAVRFPEKGIYMFHCHILEHEDNGMMGQIKVE